jgi:predicted ATP-grasp superfamily ATP-dependent carboligase
LTEWPTASSHTTVVSDRREAQDAFDRLAGAADWTVVIAPETDGHLLARCRRALEVGGRLLGPAPELVALAGDKQATAEHLAAAGIRVPAGIACREGPPWPHDFSYPAVWKPRDGAGSQGVRFLADAKGAGPAQLIGEPTCDFMIMKCEPSRTARDGRLEQYCAGLPASIAVMCGPGGLTPLAPCRQLLSDDGRFSYLGGSLPLPAALLERATTLALEAAGDLPRPVGYLGFDLVLGERQDGSDDVVIEVNPRLTTSYIGLRAACRQNLAAAMLAIAEGESPAISFRDETIHFAPAP